MSLTPILLRRFRGMAPKVEPHLLPDDAAEFARNCDIQTGGIRPLRLTSLAATLAKVGTKRSIYRFGENLDSESQYWLHWLEDTDCVRSPTSDTQELTFFTRGADALPPQWTDATLVTSGGGTSYPNVSRLLGVPRPAQPTVTVVSPSITSITHTTTTAHATLPVAHGYSAGEKFGIIVAGVAPANYNGAFEATATSSSTFDYTMTADPAANASGTMTYYVTTTPETRAYTYTLRDENQKQSQPAPPVVVTVYGNQHVVVSAMDTTATWPDGRLGTTIIESKAIWRTVTGASSQDYRFVGETLAGTTDFTDTLSTTLALLNERCPSLDWDTPPANLHGLITMPGGFLVGFEHGSNKVRFSEPRFPHAWPINYEQATKAPVVGLGHFGHTVVVLTKSRVYMGQGTDPLSITLQETGIAQSCASKRSITSSGDGVRYASPDGLIVVGINGSANLTESLMTRDQWQALNPSSIVGFFHDNRYVGFYDNGTTQGGFVLDSSGDAIGLVMLDFHATGGYVDPRTDTLFLIVGGEVRKWDSAVDSNNSAWRSKRWRGRRGNYTAARVKADTYPVTLDVYGDGALVHTQVVTSVDGFRLPAATEYSEWQFALTHSSHVTEVALAADMDELDSL